MQNESEKDVELFKVNSEHSVMMKVQCTYLNGLEQLYNSRRYEMAKENFEEVIRTIDNEC